ncbi:MAG: radical SAM protein [Porticoccus sp.]
MIATLDRNSALVLGKVSRSGLKLEWQGQSIRLDQDGRWCSYRNGRHFYRRCVDGEVVLHQGDEGLIVCDAIAASQVLDEVHHLIRQLLNQLDNPENFHLGAGVLSDVKKILALGLHCDGAYYQDQKLLFDQVYPEPVSILPPDRYRDLVVQPAIGCPSRECTFCAFYRDRPFRILSADEFDRQIDGLRQLLGKSISGRDGIFLGSANGMVLSQRRMMQFLARIQRVFGVPRRGIASFYDPYHSPVRSLGQWQSLRGEGLRRVVIGLETGFPSLREQLGKSPSLNLLYQSVALLKQAGINIGVTVLVGAGGKALGQHHVQQTVEVLKALPLSPDDLVYLSPLKTEGLNIEPQWVDGQMASFRSQLGAIGRAKALDYQMNRFRYYS